jgi:hypothetical protein
LLPQIGSNIGDEGNNDFGGHRSAHIDYRGQEHVEEHRKTGSDDLTEILTDEEFLGSQSGDE